MPRVHETRWDVRSRREHEAREIRNRFVVQHVDCRQDDQPNERDAQRKDNVECAFAEVVGAICDAQQHDEANGIRRHGPQVRLDDRVSEPLDDLREEVGRGGECDGVGEGDTAPERHSPGLPFCEAFAHVEVVRTRGGGVTEGAASSNYALCVVEKPG